MKENTNTYSGMNKDVSFDSIRSDEYLHAEDIRIVTEEGESNKAIVNVKGNKLVISLTNGNSVIGYAVIRNKIIVFLTSFYNEEGGSGSIRVITYDNECNATMTTVYQHNDLKFSKLHPIEAIGRYENECTQRVVFSDFYNRTRTINIADSRYTAPFYGSNLPVEELDIFPDNVFKTPILKNIEGGDLPVGVYQYSFKLLEIDGSISTLSTSSKLIPLYSVSNKTNTLFIKGGIKGTSSGKSIRMEIDLSNIDRSIIRKIIVVRTFKESYGEVPLIKEIEEIPITNNSIYSFLDVGFSNDIQEITYENFVKNQYPFYTNKTFSTKDDLLLVSNIKQEVFTLDNVPIDSFITERFTGAHVSHSSYLNTTYGVPVTEGIYNNPFNDESGKCNGVNPVGIEADWYTSHNDFKYQSGFPLIIGGESSNGFISYTFTTKKHLLDFGLNTTTDRHGNMTSPQEGTNDISLNAEYVHKTEDHRNAASSYTMGHVRGYKRGETYRFGIVFFDKKGASSFVYYIGDIKFPGINDQLAFSTIAQRDTDTKVYGLNLGVEFNINLPPAILAQISGYRIVRVNRDTKNSTRLYQGFINDYHDLSSVRYGKQILTPYNRFVNKTAPIDKELVAFFSPETSHNKFTTSSINDIDIIRPVGIFKDFTYYENNSINIKLPSRLYKARRLIMSGVNQNANTRAIVKDAVYAQGDNFGTLSTVNFDFKNYSDSGGTGGGDVQIGALQGTNLTLDVRHTDSNSIFGSALTSILPTFIYEYYLMEYQKLLSEQYGGVGAINVSNNKYIACTDKLTNNGTIKVFGGDTYISYYDCPRLFWDKCVSTRVHNGSTNSASSDDSFYRTMVVPVESRINNYMNTGFNSTVSPFADAPTAGDPFYKKTEFNNIGPYFRYNDVYSETDRDITYFAIPDDFDTCNRLINNDIRTMVSDPKINGEIINSWNSFRINNYLDVDTKYGAINRLLSVNDNIFYIQDKAVGYFSINPRAIVNTSDNIPTELGTAKGLVDYVYVSTKYGSIHQWACLTTSKGIWFFDAINKKMINVSQGTTSVSDIKGLRGFFNRKTKGACLLTKQQGGDNPIMGKGIHCTHDMKHNQVLFTFLGSNKDVKTYTIDATTVGNTVVIQPGEIFTLITALYGTITYINITPSVFNTTLGALYDYIYNNPANNIAFPLYTEDYHDDFTIGFNEITISYESFYKFTPPIYLNNNDIIISPKVNSTNRHVTPSLHRHDCGDYGVYYDNDPVELQVSVVINGAPDYHKILRFLEYDSYVLRPIEKGTFYEETFGQSIEPLLKSSLRDETLSAIRIYNDIQDTGKIDLTTTREFKGNTVPKYLQRKFEKWRVRIPRNNQLSDLRGGHSNISKDRMRGTYFVVELFYKNNNDKSFKLNRLKSYFDFQIY